ncbi:MAG TPA: NADP-dependent oxidoreductase [Actinomycetota bacterium]|jgi:NADPH:quinone reductase-like Zn-dependent oxidoreductase
MASIRALVLQGFDQEPVVADIPSPEPKEGEVLVRVAAASINFYDVFVANGAAKAYMSYEFPAVLGSDVAGVVEAVGRGVEGFAAGDRVFGRLGFKGAIHDGTIAELASPMATDLAHSPDGLRDEQGGSLGVAGTTAMDAIDAVSPEAGSTVLVIGATGGVGSIAVQLAAIRGAAVIASVRPGDEEFVRDLGAADTVDYTGDLVTEVRTRWPDGVGAVVDLVNRDQAVFADLTRLIGSGGIAVSVVGGAGEETNIGGVRVANVSGSASNLAPLGDLVATGRVRVPVTKRFGLTDAAEALRDFRDGHTLGKVVVTTP